MKKFKYLLIDNESPSLHNNLYEIETITNINHTQVSKKLKNKHFIEIDDFIIYKLCWKNKPPPIILRFD